MTDDTTITCADDFDDLLTDGLRVGSILTLKGRLDAVLFGNDSRISGRLHNNGAAGLDRTDPSLVIHFSDWSELYVTIASYASAKGLRIPLSTYVVVKAMVIDEDGSLMAVAIWENGDNPVPIALAPPGLEKFQADTSLT